jgi:uncharacterized protein (TIRG00374 family)
VGTPPLVDVEGAEASIPAAAHWAKRWTRWLVVPVVVLALAVIGLHGRLPAPADIIDALVNADQGWILIAVLLQVASIGAFALQQRFLLRSMGVRLRRRRAVAVVLAGTAISIAVPAGAVASAAFTVREYRRAGATREIAIACTILSGLVSICGLALLYAGGGLVFLAGSGSALSWEPLLVVVGLAAITVAATLVGRRRARGSAPDRAGSGGRAARILRTVSTSLQGAWRAGAELRAREWAAALTYGIGKWVADLACLAAAVRALDQHVSLTTLAGVYLSAQIVRNVPLAPGGIGLVDTALVAGLTAAGADAISAAAAVLIYRLLSCWFLVPTGGAAAWLLRGAAVDPGYRTSSVTPSARAGTSSPTTG